LNQLAQAASGEVLFFTDANAHIERSCLRRMVRHFADERVGCITGRTRSMEDDTTLAVGAGASIYWDYESRVSQLESELGSVLVCDGAIHCARRSLYTSLSPDLANDLELPLRIRSRGYLNLFEPRAVTLESDTSSPREEFARRRRICGQGALGMWQLRGILRGFTAWQFLSRKFLRWLTLVPLLLVLTGSVMMIDLPVFAALTALQLAFYAAALGAFLLTLAGRHTGRVLSLPFYSVLGAVGALSGVVETCLGRRYDLWEVPKASRGQGLIPDEHRSKA
jgi:cellulose synthase/poly-beta-1,6-N-acetylglucosamine synthase-like glycosyltransferase